MGIIRLVIAFLYLVFFLLIGLPYALLLNIICRLKGESGPDYKLKASYRFISWGFRCETVITGSKLKVTGLEKIPADRPCVFIANHRSIFDIVILVALIPGPMGIIAKQSTRKIPLLTIWMNNIHCKYLDRNDVKQGLEVILSAVEEVKNGLSILIFPEGTRNKTDQPIGEFHAGSFKIATRANAPVIPVTLTGTREIFEAHFPFLRPSDVTVTFADPVETAGMDRTALKELPGMVQDLIKETYLKEAGIE